MVVIYALYNMFGRMGGESGGIWGAVLSTNKFENVETRNTMDRMKGDGRVDRGYGQPHFYRYRYSWYKSTYRSSRGQVEAGY